MCPFCLSQEGEKKGLSPEEVYTSMKVAGNRSFLPCMWLEMELPLLLDQIRMLVATFSSHPGSEKTIVEHTVSFLLSGLVKDFLILKAYATSFSDTVIGLFWE